MSKIILGKPRSVDMLTDPTVINALNDKSLEIGKNMMKSMTAYLDSVRDRTVSALKLTLIFRCVALIALSSIASGCSASSRASSRAAFAPQCQSSTPSSTDISVAFSATNEDEKKKVLQVINSIARIDGRQITVAQIEGDELHIEYSNQLDRPIVQRIGKAIVTAPVTDRGIVAAFEQVHTLAERSPKGLKAFIITNGSSDAKTLADIRRAAISLKPYQCFQLKVIGVSSIHRLKLAESLHPIGDKLQFASNNRQEWQQLID
jgi:hypothetical protein